MEDLYKTMIETATICYLSISGVLMLYINYYLKNSRKSLTELHAELDSQVRGVNKSLTNLEGGLGELHNNLIKLDKDIIYLTRLVDGASLSRGYNEKSLE